jgi:DNA-binding MarR family transcriptional regulator
MMARSSKLAAVAASAPESETDAADVKSRLDLGELNTHIGYFARRFQVWIFQDLIRELARAEIRISHYSVLAIIEANPGLAQAEVAEAVGIEPARLVRVLDELERRGWIQRMRSATDRRSHALYLTQDGEKAFAHIKNLTRQHETHVIERLGATKYESLMEMLKEIDRES